MGPDGSQPAPPYALVDNPDSPLDVTDLAQVDAMMTGYSRPVEDVQASDYTGARNAIRMFAEFKFRSAGLASELQENEGIELNGIMLLGTDLDSSTSARRRATTSRTRRSCPRTPPPPGTTRSSRRTSSRRPSSRSCSSRVTTRSATT